MPTCPVFAGPVIVMLVPVQNHWSDHFFNNTIFGGGSGARVLTIVQRLVLKHFKNFLVIQGIESLLKIYYMKLMRTVYILCVKCAQMSDFQNLVAFWLSTMLHPLYSVTNVEQYKVLVIA